MSKHQGKQRRVKLCEYKFKSRLFVEPLEERTLLNASGLPPIVNWHALTADPSSYDPSRILVHFRPEADAYASSCLSGTEVEPAFSLVPGLHEVRLSPGVTVAAALAAYRAQPFVLDAQPDYRIQLTNFVTPDDPQFGSQWDLTNTGQSGGTPGADIQASNAWSVTTGSGRTIVAVIDTGIDYTHPDLAANIWTNPGEIPGNGLDDEGDGYVDDIHGYDFVNYDGDPMDDHGHGTHVAGTIGAVGSNGVGVTGINWHVKLMALKFMDAQGSGFTSDAIRALNYAVAHGAALSNNSWGGGSCSPELAAAIQSARNAGHIFVTAAGNDATNVDVAPSYPASYNLDNVVTVAATDRNDQLAYFSNYGASTVELAAPGVSILSTTPHNTYTRLSGTSMAAPHVAGVLVLVRDLHPNWTYRQVIDQVLNTVDRLPALQGKTVTGGRLNTAAAVGYSDSIPPVPPPTDSIPPEPPGTVPEPPDTTPTPPDTTPTPLSPEEAYVQGVYRDVLGREVDAVGLSFWVQLLQSGVARDNVARGVWESVEHRALQVDQYYTTFLHRSADGRGRAQWVNSFLNGASEVEVMRGFVASGEYQAFHASATSFVAGLFADVLGRAPDAVGLTNWLRALAEGQSRETIALAFLSSAEAGRRSIDAFYRDYLHRPADASGEQYWLDLLQSGRATLEAVAASILGSGEYLNTSQSR